MRRTFVFVAVALSLCACGRQGKTGADGCGTAAHADSSAIVREDTAADEREAGDSLRAVYADVFAWYAKAEKDISLLSRKPDFEARYMSSSYNTLYRRVLAADEAVEKGGEIGFFDSDHWICGQDFQNLSATVAKVTRLGAGKCAAEVVVTNCGQRDTLGVDLVKEGESWKIDDFRRDGESEKAQMRAYLKAQ